MLQEMFASSEWRNSKWGRIKSKMGNEVKMIYERFFFFLSKTSKILKGQELLIKVLRLVDENKKLTMDFIYEDMD